MRMTMLALAVLALIRAHDATAADDPCKPVFDAITHLVKTPNHQFLTQTNDAPGSTPHATEVISTGTATYIFHDGKWDAMSMTPEQALKLDEENRKRSKASCSALKEESLNGVGASVYSLRSDSEFGKSEGRIWIAKVGGLPLRQTIDLSAEGKPGKTHVETRFVYAGVVAPAGVPVPAPAK
jgi:hypothetical protein